MTFQINSPHSARFRLIAINGVLFAVRDKETPTPFRQDTWAKPDTELYPHKHRNSLRNQDGQLKRTKKKGIKERKKRIKLDQQA
jgi:hypothetical protein